MAGNSRDFNININGDSTKARRAFRELDEAVDVSGNRWKGVLDSFGGNLLANGVGKLTEAATDLGRAAWDFGLDTIDKGSDYTESLNAIQVSYGDVSDEIIALGDTSAKTFGLSKNDINGYAVQFSAFSKAIAGEGGDVAGTFESIVGRATDFASVMNLEVSDALELFQSGLAGETEPLRKYGIDLSASAVEAFALAEGMAESASSLTEAQKQQARYQFLLKQTDQVQGDFANTSGELANMNRINAAEWENIQTELGQNFLPIAGQLAGILNEDVLPALGDVVEEAGPKLQTAFEEAGPHISDAIGGLVDNLPGLIEFGTEALPDIVEGATDLIPVLVGVADSVVAIADGIKGFAENNEEFFDGVREFFGDDGTDLTEKKLVPGDNWWSGSIVEVDENGDPLTRRDRPSGRKGTSFADPSGSGGSSSFGDGMGKRLGGPEIVPKLALGGVTVGETLAWIGDNPGGREVVQPLDSLREDRRADIQTAVDAALARVGAGTGPGVNITNEIHAPSEIDVHQLADLIGERTEYSIAVAG